MAIANIYCSSSYIIILNAAAENARKQKVFKVTARNIINYWSLDIISHYSGNQGISPYFMENKLYILLS